MTAIPKLSELGKFDFNAFAEIDTPGQYVLVTLLWARYQELLELQAKGHNLPNTHIEPLEQMLTALGVTFKKTVLDNMFEA